MKNILVPTDFSDSAKNAVEASAQLAKEHNAKLILLHVESKKKLFESAQNNMDKNVEELSKIGVKVEPVLLNKKLEGSIINQTKEQNADLVVMGAQGQDFSKKLLGSNTERVLRLSKVPVLVIRNEIKTFKVKNIVFASNFFRENEGVFDGIHEFSKLQNAKIHLVKIITPRNFENTPYTEKLLSDFIENVGLENCSKNIFNYDSTHKGILEFSKRVNADLIAMTTHGKKGLSKYLVGSTAESVSDDAEVPVLSIKIPYPKPNDAILFPE